MSTKLVYTTLVLIVLLITGVQLASITHLSDVSHAASAEHQIEAPASAAPLTEVAAAGDQSKEAAQNQDLTPTRIVIEKAHIDLTVVSAPLTNGTWAVTEHVANFAEGTSLINPNSGNVGLYAHDRKDGFTNIKLLKKDDLITVYSNTTQAVYRVTSSQVIEPTAVSVFYASEDPTLTLVTCNGLFSDKRYMVKAALVEIK